MVSAGQLENALDSFPRIPLGNYPTPIEYLPRLSEQLGREIYIKRDDQIGPGLGGNKTRKLEYLLADALKRGDRKVVTFGGPQSNHVRITAAAANKIGLEPHLFFFERKPPAFTGNLLIDELLGARLHFIPFGGGGKMTLERSIRLVRTVALLRVGPHYFIPVGGHSWLGCLGYVRAAVELDRQVHEMGIEKTWLICAAGTGGTLVGLIAGLSILESAIRPLAIDVGRLWLRFPDSIARLAGEICSRVSANRSFSPDQVPLIESTYVGERYATHTPACLAAIRLLATLEGILLDPIYTAKAFAGMLDLIQKGNLGRDEPVIFLHTGGLPGVFAFGEEVLGIG